MCPDAGDSLDAAATLLATGGEASEVLGPRALRFLLLPVGCTSVSAGAAV